jgi:hypothetical protein
MFCRLSEAIDILCNLSDCVVVVIAAQNWGYRDQRRIDIVCVRPRVSFSGYLFVLFAAYTIAARSSYKELVNGLVL